MTVQLLPHQLEAIENLDNGKILWGGVGTGKSLVAVSYYMKKEADADVYVITTPKKRDSLDWESDFAQVGVGRHLSGTVAGSLVVDSWNNIGRYTDIRNAFFIFDEQRAIGAGEWSKQFIRIAKANRWIILSATPGDTWLDYIPVFVANGFYKNRTDFKQQHVVYSTYTKFPKVDRYISVGRLVRLRNSILVEMPYIRHTVRKTRVVPVDYDKDLMDKVVKKRWNVFEERPLRDVAALFSVSRRVANSHSSRTQTIETLLQEHPKIIVFYNFNYELEALRILTTRLASTNTLGDGPISEKPKKNERKDLSEPSGNWISERPSGQPHKSENQRAEFEECLQTTKPLEKSSKRFSEPLPTINGNFSRNSVSDTPSLVVAEWNGHKHEDLPEGDSWIYLVQYTAGAEGWNCTTTDAMVFYSLNYSYKSWQQAFGRIDRLNTPFVVLNYYVLKSSSWIDNAIWKSLREKKSFNESKYGNGHFGTD